ncbi:isochorismatase family protein [Taklimakanibacter lacteus]|uniref:isochorismatase family protein n=1 Tax=Taklimakanibacter lacteus TaxID=2268456 RepID=UPI000E6682B1
MRTTLSLKGRTVALLLVDLQEEQRHDPQYKAFGMDRILGNAARLLEAARATGRVVVHAAYIRDFSKRPPRPFEPTSSDGRPTFSDAKSPMTAICHEVAPRHGEPVIVKNDASAFCEGDLAPLLREKGIEWLIVSGVWTEACIAATIRDAMAQGFRVLLVKDACGSGTEAMHRTATLNLANRLYGGAVADTERALALLQDDEAQAWVAERPVPILFNFTDAAELYDGL